jgi:hypothetical protein
MNKLILLIAVLSFGTAHAQLQIKNLDYKVLASAQKDSLVAEYGDSMHIKQPNYLGGSSLLSRKLNELLAFDTWKKKKAGVYTAYVTKNWDEISVISNNKKSSDMDLLAIAAALKKTAPRWSSYTVGEKSVERYTLEIVITLEE